MSILNIFDRFRKNKPGNTESVDPEDCIDGCELDFERDAIKDKEVLHVVLFADVLDDADAIKQRKKEYRKLFK